MINNGGENRGMNGCGSCLRTTVIKCLRKNQREREREMEEEGKRFSKALLYLLSLVRPPSVVFFSLFHHNVRRPIQARPTRRRRGTGSRRKAPALLFSSTTFSPPLRPSLSWRRWRRFCRQSSESNHHRNHIRSPSIRRGEFQSRYW